MKVSIIVPTYNRFELLTRRCLPSIHSQTVRDWELLVVGDGTDQLTVDAMEMLCRVDPRVRFWNLPHAQYPEDPAAAWCVVGVDSLNWGLDHAKGEHIAVLADDDAWEPDMLETLLGELERTGADFAYGMSKATWANGEIQMYGKWPPGPGAFCDGAYVYRRALGYRYERDALKRGMVIDMDMWTRMLAGGVNFTFVPKVVHRYYPARQK